MRHLLLAALLVVVVGCGNSDTAPDEQAVKPEADTTGSTNAATVEPQDASRTGSSGPESVAAGSGDTEEDPRWYERFVVSQDNQRALQSGTIKAREAVTIDLEAKNKRHIGFGTNVFQDRIRFADGETIIFHQTKGAVSGIGVTSKDGNGGGQEFTPVDGQLCFQLENNSNHTLKYVIYEVVENKEAVPHPTSTNSTASQSQTQDSVPVVNSIGMHFVPIPAGTFTRGQGESAHKVTLTQAFHLGQYEVTQEQYKQVMGKNPSGFKDAAHPVETVNWNEAVEFCRKLSAMPQEKSAGFVYRLPTDAEWEYASRAGTTTGFSFGDASAEMGNYGWLTSNSQETTHPVGQKKPNPWGLYDMYGNVWEWCLDWDGRRSSGRSVPVTDPTGPASGSLRVFRGGGWKSSPRNCRPDNRGKLGEVYRGNTLGLRVVRTLARPASKPTKAVATVVNSIGMHFVPIPTGTFMMGEGKTAHQVTLTQSFHLGQYEVTQEHYEKVMGKNPSKFKGKQKNPVEQVSWTDAVEFCRKLSDLPAEKSAGHVYRLPTEAEWECACRAGTKTKYSFGDSEAELGEFGWYGKNSSGATVVGGKKPNSWGLYDMHGNVNEWCQDWYGSYPSGAVTDPTGPSSGSRRVTRGGSWLDSADSCRSARSGFDAASPDDQYINLGFRVVRSSIK